MILVIGVGLGPMACGIVDDPQATSFVVQRSFTLGGMHIQEDLGLDAGATVSEDSVASATLHQDITLSAEKAELMGASSLSRVGVTSLRYSILSNTLGLDFTSVDLWVGQGSQILSEMATPLGSLDPPPERDQMGAGDVVVDGDGARELSLMMEDAGRPFRLFVTPEVSLGEGKEVPAADRLFQIEFTIDAMGTIEE